MAWLLLGGASVHAVHASPAADSAGSDCVVSGRGLVERGVAIYGQREGGSAIATFASQEVTLEVSDVPSDLTQRAKLRTLAGGPALRIDGWVDPTRIPLSARQEIPVVPGHVWIATGERLKLTGAAPGQLVVESVFPGAQMRLRGKATCSQVVVGRAVASDLNDEPPTRATHYVLRNTTLELFDAPQGSPVFTLEVPSPGTGILLFSTDPVRAGYLHVEHVGRAVIDAWARASELRTFPKGEMLDTLDISHTVTVSPAQLKVDGVTREVRAPQDVRVRLAANDAAKVIGTFDGGAALIVLDSVAGWSRVYPKSLDLLPPEGKDFWVKSSDVGIVSK